jgi:pSer/pThr/pTyr-binding forkhead associated (FHA) protein
MERCPFCEKENPPGLLFCEHCGRQIHTLSQLPQYRTQELKMPTNDPEPQIKSGTGYLHQSSFVTLDVMDSNRKIYLKTEGHISLGRADKEANWQPTIDLSPYGGAEKGVSRAHADLYFESDQVFLLELGSANGTRINGLPVQTGQAQLVHNGDILELGKLRVRVYF